MYQNLMGNIFYLVYRANNFQWAFTNLYFCDIIMYFK
jgi:hypothetical protein